MRVRSPLRRDSRRDPRRHRPLLLQRLLTPVLALVVSASAVAAVGLLQWHAERVHESQLLVAQARTTSQVLRAVPWDADQPEQAATVAGRLRAGEAKLRHDLSGLYGIGPARAELLQRERGLETVVGPFLRLVRAGDVEKAQALNARRVEPAFARFDADLARTSHRYERRAESDAIMTVAGTVGIVTLALLFLGALVVRGRRVRRRAHRAERALQISEQQYRLLFEQNPNPMWVYDLESLRFLAVNEAAVGQYGYSEEEFLGMTVLQIRSAEDGLPPSCDRRGNTSRRVGRHLTRAGEAIDVEVSGRDVRFRDRDARLVLAEDVTQRQRAAAAMEESESRYRDLFENATAPFATLDLEERITEVNTAFAEVLGYSAEELVGTRIDAYLAPAELGVAEQQLERKLRGEATLTRYEQRFIAKDGRTVVFEVETRLLQRDGRPAGTQGICRDITAQKQAESELCELAELNRRQALRDPLTGLPNRLNFTGAIQAALAGDRPEFAVMLLDLDRFKEINDTLGHEQGDLLLAELARVLVGSLGEHDVLARLGGDEFGILLRAPGGNVHGACTATLERVEQLLRNPLVVEDLPLSVEASVGVACYPADGDAADTLLRHADVALSQAKREAAYCVYYRPELDRHDKAQLQLLGELRRALDEHELILHYQPKLSLHDGQVRRVEALVRWAHPSRGLLPPCAFIELAEQTWLMGPLTLYVIEAALRQAQRWDAQGLRLDVAVNLSARNLSDPTFPDAVADLLERYADTPGRLLLELTESALIADPTSAVAVLQQLDALGVGLALDDFGTGYTSLASLSRLPLHQIKIDRSFVTDLVDNPQHAAIVRSIIHLAHDLELEVVGEGVETAAVNSRLKRLGCDLVQGYFYTHPLPPDELAAWVGRRRSIAAVA